MTLFYISIAVLVVLIILAKMKPEKKNDYPYVAKPALMTKSEIHFYKTLAAATSEKDVLIMSKVRLWDLISVSKGTENRRGFENKIRSKHVDFVLCNPETMVPRLIIELDDKSHQRKDRIESDVFKNNALEAAKLPLLRVTTKKTYKEEEISSQIQQLLN